MVYLVVSLVFLHSASAAPPQISEGVGELSYVEVLGRIPGINGLSQPITLIYTGGAGIKTAAEPSLVGLGWSLTFGSINRMITGIPDDYAYKDYRTIYVNNYDDSQTDDTRSWWEKWKEVVVFIIVLVVVVVVAVLTGGASLAGTGAVLSAIGGAFVGGSLIVITFATSVITTLVLASMEGKLSELKLFKDVLAPALISAAFAFIGGGVADKLGPLLSEGGKIGIFLAEHGLQVSEKIIEVSSVVMQAGTFVQASVTLVQVYDFFRGKAPYTINQEWRSIYNTDTAAGLFIERPFGYITYDEYFSDPSLLPDDARTDWYSFFDPSNAEKIFIPRTALYTASDIKARVYQYPAREFGKADMGTMDSWTMSGGPGGTMHYEPFKGFRTLNGFKSPEIEYFRGDSGLIEMFVVTDIGGKRFVYGSLNHDAGDKEWVYVSGAFAYYYMFMEGNDQETKNKHTFAEFTLDPYVINWKLTAVLGPEYRGPLNPLENSVVKFGSSECSLGTGEYCLSWIGSNKVEVFPDGSYECSSLGTSYPCEVIHDTSHGSWVAYTYKTVYAKDEPTGSCGYNFGQLDGQPSKQIEPEEGCFVGSTPCIKDEQGNKWEIVYDESYFGGYGSKSYINRIYTPVAEARFSTSERLDALESDYWTNDELGAADAYPSGMNVGEDYSGNLFDYWKTPWTYDHNLHAFSCRDGSYSSVWCAGTEIYDGSEYLAANGNSFPFTCDANPVDRLHKLNTVEILMYNDNSQPERVKKIYFNKYLSGTSLYTVSQANQYRLKKYSAKGAPSYNRGVYTLNSVVVCGQTDSICDDEFTFAYNEV